MNRTRRHISLLSLYLSQGNDKFEWRHHYKIVYLNKRRVKDLQTNLAQNEEEEEEEKIYCLEGKGEEIKLLSLMQSLHETDLILFSNKIKEK